LRALYTTRRPRARVSRVRCHASALSLWLGAVAAPAARRTTQCWLLIHTTIHSAARTAHVVAQRGGNERRIRRPKDVSRACHSALQLQARAASAQLATQAPVVLAARGRLAVATICRQSTLRAAVRVGASDRVTCRRHISRALTPARWQQRKIDVRTRRRRSAAQHSTLTAPRGRLSGSAAARAVFWCTSATCRPCASLA